MENIKNVILRKAKIIDSQSKFSGQTKDLLIVDGIIKKIDNNIKLTKPFLEVEFKNLHISPGWLDLHARLGEPGYEQRETINSGLNSAAKGGFTALVTMPSTNPPIETKSNIHFLIKKAMNHAVNILPSGCITKGLRQNEITEMFDMYNNGAVAFTDDKITIQNSMLMNIALEYVKNFDGLIMHTCLDENLNKNGQINEGVFSTKMGLEPSPELAEELIVMRDLALLKYTNSKLHISTISSEKSVQHILKAKKANLRITTDIAAHQIILDESAIEKFNSNFKVMPPIRCEKNRLALIEGLINGSIDAVSSDHSPIEIENKECEFQKAKFGIIGLETVFPIINTVLKDKIDIEKIIDLISTNPRKITNQKIPIIQENERANITLFDPLKKWVYSKDHIQSISKNTPFIDYSFTGKVLGIINNGKTMINN